LKPRFLFDGFEKGVNPLFDKLVSGRRISFLKGANGKLRASALFLILNLANKTLRNSQKICSFEPPWLAWMKS
jgi:hypothetical protein